MAALMNRKSDNLESIRSLALALSWLPPISLGFLIYVSFVDIPVWDSWTFVEVLDRYYKGALSLLELSESQNGHRSFFPKLLMLGMAIASSWNTGLELLVNFIFGVLVFLIYLVFCKNSMQQNSTSYGLVILGLSVLLFSLRQHENWYWGWQMSLFISSFFSILSFFVVSQFKQSAMTVFLAAMAAFVATFSFAVGLVVWPILFCVLVCKGYDKKFYVGWLAGMLCCFTIYFSGSSDIGNSPSVSVFHYAGFSLALLGSPLVTSNEMLAGIVGAVGLMSAIAGLVYMYFRYRLNSATLFCASLIAFSVMSALAISYGRAPKGYEAALSSRYTTFTIHLWAALFIMFLYIRESLSIEKKAVRAGALCCALILVAFSLLASINSRGEFSFRLKHLTYSKPAFLTDDPGLKHRAGNVCWDPDFALEQAKVLKRYGLSLYR
jgi:hypothetical protein